MANPRSFCARNVQGFQRAAGLAPRPASAAVLLATWSPLASAAAAAVGLSNQLGSTAAALQLERVDAALAAADARQQMLEGAEACWAAAAAGGQAQQESAAALALAFAAFSEEQAAAVLQLQRLAEARAEADDGEDGVAPEEAAALLEGMQRLILGYASTAVAVRDTTSEALFTDPDGGSLLDWLSEAVQAADSISTVAAELQLLLPQLLALLRVPAAAGEVAAAVAAAGEQLDATGTKGEEPGEQEQLAAEEQAAAAMQPLLDAAALHPAVAGLLHGLQRAQAAGQLLLPADGRPPPAQQRLLLAGAAVALWVELEFAASARADEGDELAADSAAWRRCSAALAAAVAQEVVEHLLPPLAAALHTTAQQLKAAAPTLARRAGLEAAAAAPLLAGGQPARQGSGGGGDSSATPELVAFTAFDNELPAADMLLGGLEEDDGLSPAGSGGGSTAAVSPAGPSGGAVGAGLVPFLDFDEGLAGAGEAACIMRRACWCATQAAAAAMAPLQR